MCDVMDPSPPAVHWLGCLPWKLSPALSGHRANTGVLNREGSPRALGRPAPAPPAGPLLWWFPWASQPRAPRLALSAPSVPHRTGACPCRAV